MSHAVYNVISITCVLSAFDPLQHAFLNVTKRVTIVLVFYLLVQSVPSPLNIMSGLTCLVVSILGTQVSSVECQNVNLTLKELLGTQKRIFKQCRIPGICDYTRSADWIIQFCYKQQQQYPRGRY